MSRVFKLAISIFLLLLACGQDKTVNPDESGDLTGTLKMNGIPVEGASIQIDNILNWKATTDESGYFEIKNITLGEHTFKAYKQSGQNSYAQQESQVYINSGTNNLGEVRLPIPPKMYEIDTLTVTSNSVLLNWTPSYDSEFREYKIYRKYDPGIDESTGELIFVSTVPTDTSFNDTRFISGFKCYYRAYVLSAFGKLGGSNIVSVSTPEINYLSNGDFEISSDGLLPDEWLFVTHYDAGGSIYDRIMWDSVEYYNGNHSLKVTADSVSKDFYFIQNVIPTDGLQNGQKYKFSLWMKSRYGRIDVYFQDQNWDSILNLYVEEGTDWTYKEGIVTVTDNISSFQVLMEIYQPINSPSGLMEGWIDDVKLTIYSE